ncbi:MAG: hypothetical protein ACOX1O_08355 [Eggerthellaceae bacterium]
MSKASRTTESNRQNDGKSAGKNVLSDVSVAQITASALAAVTAMLFSSQIGIAGSVIGVAASAAVTALSTQIYKNFLDASHAKAKEKINADEQKGSAGTKVMPQVRPGSMPLDADSAQTDKATPNGRRDIYSTKKSDFSPSKAKYSHAAVKSRKHGVSGTMSITKKKWFIIALLTVIGLATVFLTAHIITSATNGEGIGTKTAPIVKLSDTESQSGTTGSGMSESSSQGEWDSSTGNGSASSSTVSQQSSSSSSAVSDDTSESSGSRANQSTSSTTGGSSSSATASSSQASSSTSKKAAARTAASSSAVTSSSTDEE